MDLLMGSFPLAARSYRNRNVADVADVANVADVADVVQFVAGLFYCMNSDDIMPLPCTYMRFILYILLIHSVHTFDTFSHRFILK